MINPFSLEGKKVLITGASSGIGRGIAIQCSLLGAEIFITGRNLERLQETLEMTYADKCHSIVSDLSTQDGIDILVSNLPILDGVVFCAGIPQVKPVKRFKRSELEDIFNINTLAPMLITSKLLKDKKIQKGASLVYIESVSGIFMGTPGDVAYNATKGGLSGFVKGAAVELASQNIRVNGVNPGLVPTEILQLSNSIFDDQQHIKTVKEKYPLGRLGTPEDIANGVIYLLSDASSWVTGINLVIDGGLTVS